MRESILTNTRIFLVRHGETGWAETNRFAGRIDIPLTEKGKQQAERLAVTLAGEQIEICFSSPLLRSRHTAGIIAQPHRLEVNLCPDFMEEDFGAWDGLPAEDVQRRYAETWRLWEEDPAAIGPENGETGYQVAARVVPAFYEIICQYKGKTILMVAHKNVNRILLAHLMDIPIREYRRRIPQETTALNLIIQINGCLRVERINDLSHLD